MPQEASASANLCADPCRGNMPLRRRTGRGLSRGRWLFLTRLRKVLAGDIMTMVLVFGTGDYLKKILSEIEEKYDIAAFLDNQIKKQNTCIEGRKKYRILSPDEINQMQFDKVVIASIDYASEMFTQLLRLGVREHNIIVDYVSTIQKVFIYDFLKMQVNQFCEDNRLDVAVKYLAIENYYGENNFGIAIYKKMQTARLKYTEEEITEVLHRFKELIKSFEKNGYKENSYIVCDEKMRIMDGAHRVACSLYFHIPFVWVQIVPQKFECDYSKEWFWENKFTPEDIHRIKRQYDCFTKDSDLSAVLWSPVGDFFENITEELSELVEIMEVRDMEFPDFRQYEDMVWKIYSADDIAPWKIEKKLEYMREYIPRLRVIRFQVQKLYYRLKSETHLPLSVALERIKRIIRKRYEEKVNPYHYDIIIHITDNYHQSSMILERLDLNMSGQGEKDEG